MKKPRKISEKNLFVGKILTHSEREQLSKDGLDEGSWLGCESKSRGFAICYRTKGHTGKHCWWRTMSSPIGEIREIW